MNKREEKERGGGKRRREEGGRGGRQKVTDRPTYNFKEARTERLIFYVYSDRRGYEGTGYHKHQY